MSRLNLVLKFAVLTIFAGGLNFIGNNCRSEVFAMESCETSIDDLQNSIEKLNLFKLDYDTLVMMEEMAADRILSTVSEKFYDDLQLMKNFQLKIDGIEKDKSQLTESESKKLNELKEDLAKKFEDLNVMYKLLSNAGKQNYISEILKDVSTKENEIEKRKKEGGVTNIEEIDNIKFKIAGSLLSGFSKISGRCDDLKSAIDEFLKGKELKSLVVKPLRQFAISLGAFVSGRLDLLKMEIMGLQKRYTRSAQQGYFEIREIKNELENVCGKFDSFRIMFECVQKTVKNRISLEKTKLSKIKSGKNIQSGKTQSKSKIKFGKNIQFGKTQSKNKIDFEKIQKFYDGISSIEECDLDEEEVDDATKVDRK